MNLQSAVIAMCELIAFASALDSSFTPSVLLTSSFSHAINHVYLALAHLGGFGVLILNFLDSSPLSVPFGNDLAMIALTASRHSRMLYYAVMGAAGSVLGCLIVDVLGRKGGEKGFEKTVGRKRFERIKRRLKKNAGWALAFASLMPPPFPFTPVVAGTAAFQYPRKKLILVIAIARFARFVIEGGLAILFGRRVLQVMKSPVVDYIVAGLIVFSIVTSALAISGHLKSSR